VGTDGEIEREVTPITLEITRGGERQRSGRGRDRARWGRWNSRDRKKIRRKQWTKKNWNRNLLFIGKSQPRCMGALRTERSFEKQLKTFSSDV